MTSQYGGLRPTNGWDRLVSLGHPSKFQRVSRLCFVTAPTSLNGGQPNFAACLAIRWAATLYVHFWELLSLTEYSDKCNVHIASKSCVLLYWQRYCTPLQQRASAKLCGVWQRRELGNFRSGTLKMRDTNIRERKSSRWLLNTGKHGQRRVLIAFGWWLNQSHRICWQTM